MFDKAKDCVDELKELEREYSLQERVLNEKLTKDEIALLLKRVREIDDAQYPEGKKCPVCGDVLIKRAQWVLSEETSICKSCHMSIAWNTSWCTGLELRCVREEKELTQKDVAKVMKWSQVYQSKMEARRIVWLTPEKATKLRGLLPKLHIKQFQLEKT